MDRVDGFLQSWRDDVLGVPPPEIKRPGRAVDWVFGAALFGATSCAGASLFFAYQGVQRLHEALMLFAL